MASLLDTSQARVAVSSLSPETKSAVALARARLEQGLSRVRAVTAYNANWRLGTIDECCINTHSNTLIVPLHDCHIESLTSTLTGARLYLGETVDLHQSRDGRWNVTWQLPEPDERFARLRAILRQVFTVALAVCFAVVALWLYRLRRTA